MVLYIQGFINKSARLATTVRMPGSNKVGEKALRGAADVIHSGKQAVSDMADAAAEKFVETAIVQCCVVRCCWVNLPPPCC